MRFFLFLIMVCIGVGYAQTADATQAPAQKPAIILPQDKVKKAPKKYTRAQLREMNDIYMGCVGSPQQDYYDCKCTAIKYLDGIYKADQEKKDINRTALKTESYLACPDSVEAAGTAFKSCLDWAPVLHPEPQPFCQCYARKFSKLFTKYSKTFIRDEEWVRREAMKQCDFTGPIIREFNKELDQDPFLNP